MKNRDLQMCWRTENWRTATALGIIVLLLAAQQFAQSQVSFDDLAQEASAAQARTEFPRAIELYSRALTLNPKWSNGWLNLGVLRYQTGAYAQARDALTRFLQLTPKPGPALGLRGLCEFETGEYARSVADIRKALSSGTADSRQEDLLLYDEAMQLTKLEKFDDALSTYASLAQRHVSTPDLLVGMGLAGLRIPLLPREAGDKRKLLESAGSAGVEFLAGDQQQGKQKFQELFERYPDVLNEHYFYGFLLFIPDPDAALGEFQREVELHPSNAQGQTWEAWALLMHRDPRSALPHARQAADAVPGSASAQLVLGRALIETGEVKTGMEHLIQASQFQPDNLEVHIALAEGYSRAGNPKAAQRERHLCLQMTKDGVNRVALP